jgi:hypothetical protein
VRGCKFVLIGRKKYHYEGSRAIPLVLLVKVGWRQSKGLESEEGKEIGSGLLDLSSRGEELSIWAWKAAL